MLTILIVKEIAMIVFYLTLPVWMVYLFFTYVKQKKKEKDVFDRVVDEILKAANDENPIVFNVSQERLIKRTADEIERRKEMEGRFR